jgi:hypothetical protein
LRVIEANTAEIFRTAEAGESPLSVVAPLLKDILVERIYWKYCDRMIRDFLGAEFVPIARAKVREGMPHYRTCYARITVHG